MKSKILNLIALTFAFNLGVNSVKAQSWPADTISVSINSGNPAFPFPQFLEYTAGKSLAKNNAVGVTHADMEKAMREGYQIMMHRALKIPGKVLNGVQYIVYNYGPPTGPTYPAGGVPSNWGFFCSEGDGYALLAAAYFADKKTFDGLWLWIHDNRLSKVKKYYDCTNLRPAYRFGGNLAGWKNIETTADGDGSNDSAADGDVDIAMALLMAYKQWGDNMGINDGCGNPISYKKEALGMIRALVDTFRLNNTSGAYTGHMSGDVGVDGYLKGGNTWDEITNWRYGAANTLYPWAISKPEAYSQKKLFSDYNAPSYFNEFAKFLSVNTSTGWQINQCLRAEASADWIINQINSKGFLPISCYGSISDDGSVVSFSNFSDGEDFRLAWRTILNYVWHGNPTTTWNPVSHTVVPGANTFEYDMAVKHANFLKVPKDPNITSTNPYCSTLGASPDPSCPNWKGVVQLTQALTQNGGCCNGSSTRKTLTNYVPGTGVAAAVASGDLDLTAELYRQNEILWDDAQYIQNGLTDRQRYILSTPSYFHDWFRLLGMLTGSGNLHSPTNMVAAANMKVYLSVDKTFAYEGDILTYTVSYRNYGSATATGVSISTSIDNNLQLISATNGGVQSGNLITWTIGNVPGFKTNTGILPTTGTVQFVVRVKTLPTVQNVCLTSTITSINAPIWISNEYPNNATYTMERNCVDLLKDRVLSIVKTTDRSAMNPGDIVNFTLNFENKTGSNLWLNGGRDRVIISYGNNYPTNGTSFYQFYRIWHSAHESYINLGNYRVSYFMNDAAAIGLYNAATNPTGWSTFVDNQSDLNKYGYNPLTLPTNQQLKFVYQKIPWGSDAFGSWNQRIVTQFANVLSAPSTHIYDKLDGMAYIHKGVVGPGFTRTRFESMPSSVLQNRLADDWSYSNTVDANSLDGQSKRFFPISPTYTDFTTKFAPVVVNNYSKDICDPNVPNYSRVLVEEFDGYVWRRIAGLGPLPGRETYDVVVTDSIPIQLSWNGFTNATTLGVSATYTALTGNPKFSGFVKWTVPVMLTGEKGMLSYSTIAKNPPCPSVDINFLNSGWIWSSVDSPDSSTVPLRLSCNKIPPTPPAQTSLFKSADKYTVNVGDVVTYKIKFINNDGSVGKWNGTGTYASEWQAAGTASVPSPKSGVSLISLDQNDNNVSGPYGFEHRKVHGKNGYIESTINPTNSSVFSYFFRHTTGTPGQSDFQGVRLEITPNDGGNNFISLVVYNNSTSIANFTGTNKIAYGGSNNPINIRVQLQRDTMYIWLNDYTGAPLKVITGISNQNAGYTGIYANGSQQKISAWKGHFDSAFNIAVSDQLPSQVSAPSNFTPSTALGVYAGGIITWPVVPGPLLAGDSLVRTFKVTVTTCPSVNFITNIATATTFGVNNISAQHVLYCPAYFSLSNEFISLIAKKLDNKTASLDWSTTSLNNLTGFYIERSNNGRDFTKVGYVKISEMIGSNFNFKDINPLDGSNFYRIIQVKNDGSFNYSKIVRLDFVSNTSVTIAPNPFENDSKILFSSDLPAKVQIFDVEGRLLEEIISKSNVVEFGSNLSNGVYFIRVWQDENLYHLRAVRMK